MSNVDHARVNLIGISTLYKADQILKIIQEDPTMSSRRKIAKELDINHTTVLNHLRTAGYTKKLDT